MTTLSFDVFARDRASSTFDKLGRSVDQSSSKLQKFQRVGALAGKALAIGLAAAGVAAVKMANSAAEDEQAQVRLATALKTAAGATDNQVSSVENWITAQGKALGVADDELRPAMARLATATGDVGKAQHLTSIAMDVSAGTGKSLESITLALVRAQNGSIDGLSRLGVATKNADGSTKSLRDVTKDMARLYSGQAAKSADTVAGKQKILQVQMAELGEEIGARLLPVLLKVSEAGLKVVDWIGKNQTVAGVFLGTIVALTATVWAVSAATKAWGAVTAVASAAQATYAAVVGVSSSTLATFVGVKAIEGAAWARATVAAVAATVATVAHSAATKAAAAAQWLLNAALSANPIGLVVIAIAALAAGFVLAYKRSATFRAIVQAVGKAGQAAIGWIVEKVGGLISVIKGPATAAFKVYAAWVKLQLKIATTAISLVVSAVMRIVSAVRGPAIAAFQAYRGVVTAVVGGVRTALGNIVDAIGRVVGAVRGAFTSVWSGVRSAATNALNGILGPINSIISKVQSLLSMIGRIKLPSLKVPSLPNIPGIPGLATGGRVTSAGRAWIAENGPELVTLPRNAQVTPLRAGDREAVMGGGDTFNVNLNGNFFSYDPHELARVQSRRQREMLALVRA